MSSPTTSTGASPGSREYARSSRFAWAVRVASGPASHEAPQDPPGCGWYGVSPRPAPVSATIATRAGTAAGSERWRRDTAGGGRCSATAPAPTSSRAKTR
ncbi:hypothetical protein ACPPVO_08855 [Dactylosporangium sp. McL0621]|uniref:hypothetical protein n=1 Tax=Dactylosporangium sp. McL0621 TaxID=3415678 RepID=UPI003CE70223